MSYDRYYHGVRMGLIRALATGELGLKTYDALVIETNEQERRERDGILSQAQAGLEGRLGTGRDVCLPEVRE